MIQGRTVSSNSPTEIFQSGFEYRPLCDGNVSRFKLFIYVCIKVMYVCICMYMYITIFNPLCLINHLQLISMCLIEYYRLLLLTLIAEKSQLLIFCGGHRLLELVQYGLGTYVNT